MRTRYLQLTWATPEPNEAGSRPPRRSRCCPCPSAARRAPGRRSGRVPRQVPQYDGLRLRVLPVCFFGRRSSYRSPSTASYPHICVDQLDLPRRSPWPRSGVISQRRPRTTNRPPCAVSSVKTSPSLYSSVKPPAAVRRLQGAGDRDAAPGRTRGPGAIARTPGTGGDAARAEGQRLAVPLPHLTRASLPPAVQGLPWDAWVSPSCRWWLEDWTSFGCRRHLPRGLLRQPAG